MRCLIAIGLFLFFSCGNKTNEVSKAEKVEIHRLDSLSNDLESTKVEMEESERALDEALRALDI